MLTAGAQDHAHARHSTISIRVVRGLVAAMELHGVRRSVVLESAQLRDEQLASAEARFTRAEVYRLCELALDVTADPALGLHWGEKQPGCTFNPLSDLIAHAPTLRHGLDALCHFHPVLSDDASFQLSESADKATLRCLHLSGAPPRIQRFASEMFVLGLFHFLRSFNGDARVERASFEYAAPSYHAEYTRVFEGAESFEQPFTGIVFDQALMDVPSPYKDEDMYEALRAIAERHMLRTQRASFALRVRELLVRQGSAGRVEMRTVARALGLSVRSLRRRLVAEGVSYISVANDALATIATHYLVDERYSIQETAFEMGFSDARAFHRAFKSWTGMTPDTLRNARSGKGAHDS